ncbi:uncharacterized protein LOC115624187 [Scaptodrosophila lebanonensis]|uniref:Uncharacterized protein LOC115624187 n=1 Tax=Drosophila lebanonensis TaxID=7225 RepID=A0A6J2TGR5_DROLE|nr:uncharacterized protein LOC115624187 [Scaptodrosophila lebanonensis]
MDSAQSIEHMAQSKEHSHMHLSAYLQLVLLEMELEGQVEIARNTSHIEVRKFCHDIWHKTVPFGKTLIAANLPTYCPSMLTSFKSLENQIYYLKQVKECFSSIEFFQLEQEVKLFQDAGLREMKNITTVIIVADRGEVTDKYNEALAQFPQLFPNINTFAYYHKCPQPKRLCGISSFRYLRDLQLDDIHSRELQKIFQECTELEVLTVKKMGGFTCPWVDVLHCHKLRKILLGCELFQNAAKYILKLIRLDLLYLSGNRASMVKGNIATIVSRKSNAITWMFLSILKDSHIDLSECYNLTYFGFTYSAQEPVIFLPHTVEVLQVQSCDIMPSPFLLNILRQCQRLKTIYLHYAELNENIIYEIADWSEILHRKSPLEVIYWDNADEMPTSLKSFVASKNRYITVEKKTFRTNEGCIFIFSC